jgi:hypothetical protein
MLLILVVPVTFIFAIFTFHDTLAMNHLPVPLTNIGRTIWHPESRSHLNTILEWINWILTVIERW